MRKLITFFVNRPVWGNAFIFVVIIFGIFALSNTKKSFFPELDPNTIVVSVFYPGASPNEMEEGVTIKIEQAVKGCLLYTSPSPRDLSTSRMPSSA